MPTLRQLRYLVAVAETRHFGRAAALCHVSQPTLSAQLQTLEARLGVLLVERSRHQVALTPLGREMAARAQAVLDQVDEMVELARRGRKLLEGRLRLGVLATLGPWLLPLVLADLRERYPELVLEPREGTPAELQALLAQGELDVLIDQAPLVDAAFLAEPLFAEPLRLALPAAHPLAGGAALALRELPILTLGPRYRLHETVSAWCATHGLALCADYAETSLDTLRLMVGLGHGAAFLPALYARAAAAADPTIRLLPLGAGEPERTIVLAWRRRAGRAEAYRVLARFLRATLRESGAELRVLEAPAPARAR